MSNSPGVIFTMKFIYKWKIGGYDYLKYMSRPEAFQKLKHEHDEEFKDYMQYMSNSEKSDGIFDMTKDKLSEKEIDEYRVLEAESQKQGCPKYIGVTSFDNDFLKENGIITPFGLDTKKLKEIARSSISEMIQKSDKLDNDNVYWTAAIHTNTDNVHIHYAILEKERRVERENDTIEVEAFDALKSKVANKIIGPEHIKKLTELSRKCLLPGFNDTLSQERSFIQLLDKLPENKKLWYYNRKEFEPYQDEVKKCVQKIILSNPKLEESYKQYVTMLDEYTEKCKRLYGDGNRHLYLNFKKNKLDDFYSRTGNAILRELKNLDEKFNSPSDRKNVLSEKEIEFFKALETTEIFETAKPSNEIFEELQNDYYEQLSFDNIEIFSSESLESVFAENYKIEWSKQYKIARKYISGTETVRKDYDKALALLSAEIAERNVLAMYDLGHLYYKNVFKLDNEDSKKLAAEFFEEAFKGFNTLYEQDGRLKEYLAYRIGKMYSYGFGTEQDYIEAFNYFLKAEGNKYAQFSLGCAYEYGNGIEIDKEKAFHYYKLSADQENAFSQYKVATAYYNGIGTGINFEKAEEYFKKAFRNFITFDADSPDHNLKYKIGYMYLNGLGTDLNTEKAIEYFRASVNQNDNSKITLATIYLNDNNSAPEQKQLAIKWLHQLSEKENVAAQFTLGKLYLTGQEVEQDKSMAIKYLTNAADKNYEYAQYILGKFFLSDQEYKNIPEAITWLEKAADNHNNQFAQYQLGKLYLRNKEYNNTALGVEYLNKAAARGNAAAQKQLDRLYNPQIKLKYQYNKSDFVKRKSQLLAATYSLKKLVNQIDGHLDQLKREFDYEEELQIAQEQYEIQLQIEYERS